MAYFSLLFLLGDLIVRLFNECSKGETALLQTILTKEQSRVHQNVLAHSQGINTYCISFIYPMCVYPMCVYPMCVYPMYTM